MKTQKIKLVDIKKHTEDGHWHQQIETGIRSATDEQVVAEYADRMTAGDKFPPIVLFREGDKYHVSDGFHRIAAADKIGAKDIEAEVRDGSLKEALWHALGANRKHGHRLTASDVARAIEIALREFPSKSQTMIAEQIGCNQSTVSRVREQLMQAHKLTPPDRTTGKDGKSRPSSRKRRPRKTAKADTEQKPVGGSEAKLKPASTDMTESVEIEQEPVLDQQAMQAQTTTDLFSEDTFGDFDNSPRYTLIVKGRNIKSIEKTAKTAFGEKAVVSIEKITHPTSRAGRLEEARGLVEQAQQIVDDLKDEMESWHDGLPDNLQSSDKAMQLEECVSNLEDLSSSIENLDFDNIEFPGMY